MADKIPVSILTGFLGAGKTTLLNAALKDPRFADTAIVVNEFGEVALDHLLVEAPQEDIVELSSGCLCCQMRGELIDILERITLLQTDNGKEIKRIIIETTGVADPIPVMQAIIGHPLLQTRIDLGTVLTLVDGVNGHDTLKRYPEARRQVAVADQVLVTKCDLVEGTGSADLSEEVSSLNEQADLVYSDDAFDIFEIFEKGSHGSLKDLQAIKATFTGNKHTARREGDIHRFSIVSEDGLDGMALRSFLDLIASAHGPQLLRVKGLVKSNEEPHRPVLIHCVQTVMHPPIQLDQWPDDDKRTRIVFIADDIDEAFIRKLYDGFANSVRPDTPDKAALTDNPLAIAGF